MNMFEILIKRVDGSVARLEFKGRRVWKIQTAKKHLQDCVTMILNDERPEWVHVVLVEV